MTSSIEPLFQTARLRVRRWIAQDLQALEDVYGDRDAMRWVGDGEPLSRLQCEEWLQVTDANYRKLGYGMFTVEARGTGAVVGFCGLVHPGGQPDVEVKYAFLRSYWGQGLATEAVAALLAFAGEILGIEHVIATVAPDNTASHRVLAKARMTQRSPRHNPDGSITHVYEWRAPNTA